MMELCPILLASCHLLAFHAKISLLLVSLLEFHCPYTSPQQLSSFQYHFPSPLYSDRSLVLLDTTNIYLSRFYLLAIAVPVILNVTMV